MTFHDYTIKVRGRVRRALDRFAQERGVGTQDNAEIAQRVVHALLQDLRGPSSGQAVLANWTPERGYHDVRVIDFDGSAEEALYPLDDNDEPVEEAVADVVWPLPHREWIPEIQVECPHPLTVDEVVIGHFDERLGRYVGAEWWRCCLLCGARDNRSAVIVALAISITERYKVAKVEHEGG